MSEIYCTYCNTPLRFYNDNMYVIYYCINYQRCRSYCLNQVAFFLSSKEIEYWFLFKKNNKIYKLFSLDAKSLFCISEETSYTYQLIFSCPLIKLESISNKAINKLIDKVFKLSNYF